MPETISISIPEGILICFCLYKSFNLNNNWSRYYVLCPVISGSTCQFITRKRPRPSIAETILSLETTAESKTTWKRLVLISKSCSSIPISSSRTVPISIGHPIHKTPSLITIPSTSNVTTNNFFSSTLDVPQHWKSIDRHNTWDKMEEIWFILFIYVFFFCLMAPYHLYIKATFGLTTVKTIFMA